MSPTSGNCLNVYRRHHAGIVALNVNPNAAAVARVREVGVALAGRQEAFEGGLADAMARPRFVPAR